MQLSQAAKSILLGSALLVSLDALAQSGTRARILTGQAEVPLSDLRSKCEAILANPQMVKPTITISCDQHTYVWRECRGQFGIQDSRAVNATIGMKEYSLTKSQTWLTDQAKDCVMLKRHHLYVRPVEDTMRCEDLLASLNTDADLVNHCDALIRDRLGSDSDLQQDQGPTGDVINTCSGQANVVMQGAKDCDAAPVPQQQQQQQQQGQTRTDSDSSATASW